MLAQLERLKFILSCLIRSLSNRIPFEKVEVSVRLPFSSKPLEGVIAHLTRECGENVHDTGIVTVTASRVYDSDYDSKNAVDLGTNSYYLSKNEKDAWICYDFKERRMISTIYSVRSYWYGYGYSHLKSWVGEV